MKSLLFSTLFLAIFSFSSAQNQGLISYEMNLNSDNPDMAMAIAMINGSTMELFFTKDKTASVVTIDSFVKMKVSIDVKANKGLMLIDAMGAKTAVELSAVSKVNEDVAKEIKIENTTETKKILQFDCTKTIIKNAEGNESIFWITKGLKFSLDGQQQFSNLKLDGIPLEFSALQNGMNVHFLATKFSETVNPEVFSMKIPEGYNLMTEEELKKTWVAECKIFSSIIINL